MDSDTLRYFTTLSQTVAKKNWKDALDALVTALRKKFVFDNLVIYLADEGESMPEVVYARAVGRGRSKEADVEWGEFAANQVISAGKIISITPPPSSDRTSMPYLFALPLSLTKGRGVLIFVRFGGPEYTTGQIPLAVLATVLVADIFERRASHEYNVQLEMARHRAQFQDDFIATISHDLHTPLGFIKGYATSLLRSDTNWDATTQREFLTIIDEETDHLITLIDRLLDSARLQSGMMIMDFQPVRLDSLIRDVKMRMCGRKRSLDVELDLLAASSIQADTIRLTEVFDNLFDNSIKYAPDAKITITLRAQNKKQIITFADQGPGIPPESLPFLFERFYRVPGQSGKRGAGLGLFICKQIIQAHHGQISVKTVTGKGTTFRIELPVQQTKAS